MKRTLILPAAIIFLFNFALAAQEGTGTDNLMLPEAENNEQSQEKVLSADELFPYKENLRTPINKKDYPVSLKRTEEIAKRVKDAFLPDAAAREKYVKVPANSPEGTKAQEFDVKEIRRELEARISKEVLNGKSVNPVGKPFPGDRLSARKAVADRVKKQYPVDLSLQYKKDRLDMLEKKRNLSEKEQDEKKDLEKELDGLKEELDELMKFRGELEKEAEKIYPLVKKGEKVTIRYSSGRTSYRVSGTFYGYGIRGKSILINSRSIPLRDLGRADVTKFSSADNKVARQRFVEAKMQKYQKEKFKYESQEAETVLQKEINENDKNGFVYFGLFEFKNLPKAFQEKYKTGVLLPEERLKGCTNKWISVDKIITDMAEDMIKVTRKRIEYELKLEAQRIAAEKKRLQEEAEKKRQEEANKNNGEEQTDGEETDAGNQ